MDVKGHLPLLSILSMEHFLSRNHNQQKVFVTTSPCGTNLNFALGKIINNKEFHLTSVTNMTGHHYGHSMLANFEDHQQEVI